MSADRKASHWGKSVRIVEQLRGRIVRGEWGPGARLPNRIALEREFGTTPATMQRVLDILSDEGLVVARGSHGTFVRDRLPHHHRIGIVFPMDPAKPAQWRRMYAAVDEEARRLIRDRRFDLTTYYGVAETDSPGYRQLFEDIAADRLAAVFIMGMSPSFFTGTPLLGHSYLRVAALAQELPAGVLPVITENFIPPAVRRLRAEGRRKVALIHSPMAANQCDILLEELARQGMTGHPNWCIPDWPNVGRVARAAAYLLARLPSDERPDAILVTDDYLAEPATRGLLEARVRVPEEIAVLVQCNFPHLPSAVTPMIRMGYDFGDLLDRVLAALLATEPPPSITLPCIDEDDWRARQATALPVPIDGLIP